MIERFRTRRFVLREPRARAEVAAVARLNGWAPLSSGRLRPGGPGFATFQAFLPGLTVAYFEETKPRLCGVFIDSVRCAEETESVRTLVQAQLVPWTLEELLRQVEEAPDAARRCRALDRAGWGAPREADPAFLACVTAAAGHRAASVRETAIRVLSGVAWPEVLPVLAGMARDDPRPAIRELAAAAVTSTEEAVGAPRPRPAPSPELFAADSAPEMYTVAMAELRRHMKRR